MVHAVSGLGDKITNVLASGSFDLTHGVERELETASNRFY